MTCGRVVHTIRAESRDLLSALAWCALIVPDRTPPKNTLRSTAGTTGRHQPWPGHGPGDPQSFSQRRRGPHESRNTPVPSTPFDSVAAEDADPEGSAIRTDGTAPNRARGAQ